MGKITFKISWLILKVVVLTILPFLVLIRGANFLHLYLELGAWFSLLLALLVTFLILWIYLRVFLRWVLGKRKQSRFFIRFQVFLVSSLLLFYTAYMLVTFSRQNAKTDRQHREYTDLHPYLRLGLSTIVFLDMSLVVTDMGREKMDYRLMGLPIKERSLHYKQADGYIHAVDLRTNNRSELRNYLLQAYFELMGFKTLRHHGTADHLHISLPPVGELQLL